jgi:hypothetical protein
LDLKNSAIKNTKMPIEILTKIPKDEGVPIGNVFDLSNVYIPIIDVIRKPKKPAPI